VEKAISTKKGARAFLGKIVPFPKEAKTMLLSKRQKGGNATNAVRHGMPCIHFRQGKRLKALSASQLILQDVSLYPQTALAPLVKLSGRLDRNHSVLIGQGSEFKQQQIIYNDKLSKKLI